eukprot:TRINITY_DN15520_c0_g1_i1.p1 TRINITY_DN15520_c0_g1~~TRINITY_DN15520_c0_g1_i1.p1  ORF type:complete len:162 (+),score=26.70 TRINITY_DN15520_c0_g1_i1:72-557(+)
MGCAVSSLTEDFEESYGPRGEFFSDACSEALFVDDMDIPPEALIRVKYEPKVRHGPALGEGCDRYHIEWFYSGVAESVCYQVVVKNGEVRVCHPSDFFRSERSPDGSIPEYWGTVLPTPRETLPPPRIRVFTGKKSRKQLAEEMRATEEAEAAKAAAAAGE